MQRLLLAEGSRGPLLDIDARTMARRLGALFLAGGGLTLLWLALPHAPHANLQVIVAVGLVVHRDRGGAAHGRRGRVARLVVRARDVGRHAC